MNRRTLLRTALVTSATASMHASMHQDGLGQALSPITGEGDRELWLGYLQRLAHPVLDALANRRLVATMPVEAAPGHTADRARVTHLEALGRTLAGIAPWLEHGATSGPEGELRARYCELARAAIAAGVDPKSPDYLRFGEDRQTIVDAAFLGLALSRAPHELRERLPEPVRMQLATALRATRALAPPYNNWLLFVAMIEACLYQLGDAGWDRVRVDYSLRSHQSWFLGDGMYGDGPHFHADYYNSIVIHPFLVALSEVLAPEMAKEAAWAAMVPPIQDRALRYAAIQERTIGVDGTYPVIGRSIAYRGGVFHHLADAAQRGRLPSVLVPAQVRGALTAVLRRTLDSAGTFDEHGWLRIGLAGHQPGLGEVYISTGSLYLATAPLLPLGLSAANPFWSGAPAPWTARQVWDGVNMAADHAVD